MEPITVRFTMNHQPNNPLGNEVLRNNDLLRRLRSFGIPVVGNISVIGVEYGKLSIEPDRDFDEWVFTWECSEDDDPAAGL